MEIDLHTWYSSIGLICSVAIQPAHIEMAMLQCNFNRTRVHEYIDVYYVFLRLPLLKNPFHRYLREKEDRRKGESMYIDSLGFKLWYSLDLLGINALNVSPLQTSWNGA